MYHSSLTALKTVAILGGQICYLRTHPILVLDGDARLSKSEHERLGPNGRVLLHLLQLADAIGRKGEAELASNGKRRQMLDVVRRRDVVDA